MRWSGARWRKVNNVTNFTIPGMGWINIHIPGDVHDDLRAESASRNEPQKDIIVEAIRKEVGESEDH